MSSSIAISQLRSSLIEEEGSTNYMYLDTEGNVTVGVGYLLANLFEALKVKWISQDTGNQATVQEITKAYTDISTSAKGNYSANYYKGKSKIELAPGESRRLLDFRILEKQKQLRLELPKLDGYPTEVQDVIIGMAFNLGTKGLVTKFPSFMAAVKKEDWMEAAKQCHVINVSAARNASRKAKLMQAAAAVAAATAKKITP